MSLLIELLVCFFLLLGSFFALVGSIGMLRFRDFYMRLHGPSKATTLGVGGILLASMLYFSFAQQGLLVHELLITMFLVISAPVSAYMLSAAAKRKLE